MVLAAFLREIETEGMKLSPPISSAKVQAVQSYNPVFLYIIKKEEICPILILPSTDLND
jgi:hypothetical protein